MISRTASARLGLATLALAAPLAVPASAGDATLAWDGGQLGGSITYDLMGDAGQLYALKPSLILTSTPLPGGTLDIGLDLIGFLKVGQLSFATGTAQETFILPADPSFSGLPIHAQYVTLPGPFGIVDEVSNRTTFVAAFPNSIHDTFGTTNVSRQGHTLTEVGDGRALLAGGVENTLVGSVVTNSLEMYDPDTQEFSVLAATLIAPRSAHTATRLADGRVLLIGGLDNTNTPVATAELFDPTTDTVSAAASMSTPRTQHTATLLNDGRVLVVAGTSSLDTSDVLALAAGTLKSSELYDPVSNTWSAGPNLPISGPYGAIGQAASVLPSGRVLVTGGVVVGSFFGIPLPAVSNGAWRYDPITNGFLSTASMSTARVYHGQLTLPSGQVLVVAGGQANFTTLVVTTLSSCELYGPANAWASAPSLNHPRAYLSVVDANDGIVVLGGLSSADLTTVSGTPEQIIESAPYATGAWTDGPSIQQARQLVAASAIDSGQRILITGSAASPATDVSAEQLVR